MLVAAKTHGMLDSGSREMHASTHAARLAVRFAPLVARERDTQPKESIATRLLPLVPPAACPAWPRFARFHHGRVEITGPLKGLDSGVVPMSSTDGSDMLLRGIAGGGANDGMAHRRISELPWIADDQGGVAVWSRRRRDWT